MPPVALELQHRGGDRDAALLLERHPVGGGPPLVLAGPHGARQFHGASVEQELLGEGRLARVGRDDREGPSCPTAAARSSKLGDVTAMALSDERANAQCVKRDDTITSRAGFGPGFSQR